MLWFPPVPVALSYLVPSLFQAFCFDLACYWIVLGLISMSAGPVSLPASSSAGPLFSQVQLWLPCFNPAPVTTVKSSSGDYVLLKLL